MEMLDNEPLYSVAELMRKSRESESTWRKRFARREIAFVRLGANVRVRKADFEDWLRSRTVSARQASSGQGDQTLTSERLREASRRMAAKQSADPPNPGADGQSAPEGAA